MGSLAQMGPKIGYICCKLWNVMCTKNNMAIFKTRVFGIHCNTKLLHHIDLNGISKIF